MNKQPTSSRRLNVRGVKTISASRYQQIIAATGVVLVLIIPTGAAVRLTQSGLGCENWPKCTEEAFVPEWGFHAWIEFGNRLISGVIGVIVLAAAFGAYRRVPKRPDLIPWAWGLVVGVIAQVVLGGVTVWVDLHPIFVGAHFLLSIVLIWNALVLWMKGRTDLEPIQETTGVSGTNNQTMVLNLSRAVMFVSTLVLVIGTLVTGTAPNSGDSQAIRLTFDLRLIAQIHSATAWIMVAFIVALGVKLAKSKHMKLVQLLLAFSVLQGGIGYLQYWLGVPPLLVELHVTGSLAVWCTALWLHLTIVEQTPAVRPTTPDLSGRGARAQDLRPQSLEGQAT